MKLFYFFIVAWISLPCSAATLSLLQPNGDETLALGSSYSITWEPAGEPAEVTVAFSSDNGGTWTTLATVANTGVYEWDVPTEPSEQCLVRIEDSTDPGVSDTSDASFILYECLLEITGDVNHDCYVDLMDMSLLAGNWLLCANPYDFTCPCAGDYADCDGDSNNGCEVILSSDPANCGQCGNICELANAVADCQDGNCVVGSCAGNYRDCDANPANGCETDIMTSISHCGSCGNACAAPHANMVCQSGSCVITSCQAGYYDCDGIADNGCEAAMWDPYESNNTFAAARFLGTIAEGNSEQSWTAQIIPTGDEDWFRIYAQEGSHTCIPFTDQDYTIFVRLVPPQGAYCRDYDLYLYSDSGQQLGSSQLGSCSEETITYTWDGECGTDDSRYFRIYVFGYGGAWSCTGYLLYVDMWQN